MNKFETCKNCPDRQLYCHSKCEGYLARVEQNKKMAEIKAKEDDFRRYISESKCRKDKIKFRLA